MRSEEAVLLSGVAVLTLGTGCFGSSATEFPAGLEPLEDNSAPAQQGGSPQEDLALVHGRDGYTWAHGRAYLHAAPAAVWAVIKDAELLGPTCALDSHSIIENSEPDYEYSFQLHSVVESTLTVEWDEAWRYGTVLGTPEAPELAMIRYQKTYGSDFIYLIEGSIQVLATAAPEITELELIEHVDALQVSTDDIEGSMTERFGKVVAVLHGTELPGCP